MDIWVNLYFGKRWVEDDGTQRYNVKVSQEGHLTSIGGINYDAYKKEFLRMASEIYDRCVETSEIIDKHGTDIEHISICEGER